MAKYVLYAVIAIIIAFSLNYFGVVDIPWLEPPVSVEDAGDSNKQKREAADKALGDR